MNFVRFGFNTYDIQRCVTSHAQSFKKIVKVAIFTRIYNELGI